MLNTMSTNGVRIILLGDSGVGKTSLLLRFISGYFRESHRRTFVDSYKKTVKINNEDVEVCLWDTSGLEEHRTIMQCYYKTAEGVLLVYDVTNVATFTQLNSWLEELRSDNKAAHVVIVGNKVDDSKNKSVADDHLKDYAKEKNLECMEVSAKSGENVDRAFLSLAEKILSDRNNPSPSNVSSLPGEETKFDSCQRTQTSHRDSYDKKRRWQADIIPQENKQAATNNSGATASDDDSLSTPHQLPTQDLKGIVADICGISLTSGSGQKSQELETYPIETSSLSEAVPSPSSSLHQRDVPSPSSACFHNSHEALCGGDSLTICSAVSAIEYFEYFCDESCIKDPRTQQASNTVDDQDHLGADRNSDEKRTHKAQKSDERKCILL